MKYTFLITNSIKKNSFDKIICRMGFMFFPDMQLASGETYRILKPGGKMAASVWIKEIRNNEF